MNQVTAMILAGGKGTRLSILSEHRAKPAVPFGGIYRIIDFTLSNVWNSGLRQVFVLTQYKSWTHTRTGARIRGKRRVAPGGPGSARLSLCRRPGGRRAQEV